LKPENANLNGENATLSSEVVEMPLLRNLARLCDRRDRGLASENAHIPAPTSHYGDIPVLESDNARPASESTRTSALTSEKATLRAEIARTRADATRMQPVPMWPSKAVNQPGTLLAENAPDGTLFRVVLEVAGLSSEGACRWGIDEFNARVVGKAPVLVLVEFAHGDCCRFAAVPFEHGGESTVDPPGTSSVFGPRHPAPGQ
jgi:hypothetical protein